MLKKFRSYTLLTLSMLSGLAYAEVDFESVFCTNEALHAWFNSANFTINEMKDRENGLLFITRGLARGGQPMKCIGSPDYYINILNIVQQLITRGIDINAQDKDGYTALMYVAGKNMPQMVVARRSPPLAPGETPVPRPFSSFEAPFDYKSTYEIAMGIAMALLQQPNINVNARGYYDKKSAANIAAESDNKNLLIALVLKGADTSKIRDPELLRFLQPYIQQRAQAVHAQGAPVPAH